MGCIITDQKGISNFQQGLNWAPHFLLPKADIEARRGITKYPMSKFKGLWECYFLDNMNINHIKTRADIYDKTVLCNYECKSFHSGIMGIPEHY